MSGVENRMKKRTLETDVCVVGGGMAGICAAISAARHGARVALVHDWPVYGGNASSEIRVGIIGADRCGGLANLRETGLIEEIRLRNLAANPGMDWRLWDLLLYGMVNEEPAIHALMNTTCLSATVRAKRIASIRAWQMTSETFYDIEAGIFIDCSGDGILAALSGADYRVGREARSEFNEPAASETADRKTMGMTCLFYARREDTPSTFQPPPWAYSYPDDYSLPYEAPGHKSLPATLVSAFRLSIRSPRHWETVVVVQENWRRFYRLELKRAVTGIRLDQVAVAYARFPPQFAAMRRKGNTRK